MTNPHNDRKETTPNGDAIWQLNTDRRVELSSTEANGEAEPRMDLTGDRAPAAP